MNLGRIVVSGAAGALLFAGSALAAVPASAEVSPHCQQDGYCLFSGSDFTGTKVGVPAGTGCRPVSGLGITTAHSAARGYGDGYALTLYSDSNCATVAATVYDEVASTSAKSYRLTPLPG